METTKTEETNGCDYNTIVKALNPSLDAQTGVRPRFICLKEGHSAAKVYDLWHVDPDNTAQGAQKKCILNAKLHVDAKTITASLNQEVIKGMRRAIERNR